MNLFLEQPSAEPRSSCKGRTTYCTKSL